MVFLHPQPFLATASQTAVKEQTRSANFPKTPRSEAAKRTLDSQKALAIPTG